MTIRRHCDISAIQAPIIYDLLTYLLTVKSFLIGCIKFNKLHIIACSLFHCILLQLAAIHSYVYVTSVWSEARKIHRSPHGWGYGGSATTVLCGTAQHYYTTHSRNNRQNSVAMGWASAPCNVIESSLVNTRQATPTDGVRACCGATAILVFSHANVLRR